MSTTEPRDYLAEAETLATTDAPYDMHMATALLGIGQQLRRIADQMAYPLVTLAAVPAETDGELEKPKLRTSDGVDVVAALHARLEAVKAEPPDPDAAMRAYLAKEGRK